MKYILRVHSLPKQKIPAVHLFGSDYFQRSLESPVIGSVSTSSPRDDNDDQEGSIVSNTDYTFATIITDTDGYSHRD
jgi:hypothetical protein